jgi:hypothetical protein
VGDFSGHCRDCKRGSTGIKPTRGHEWWLSVTSAANGKCVLMRCSLHGCHRPRSVTGSAISGSELRTDEVSGRSLPLSSKTSRIVGADASFCPAAGSCTQLVIYGRRWTASCSRMGGETLLSRRILPAWQLHSLHTHRAPCLALLTQSTNRQ